MFEDRNLSFEDIRQNSQLDLNEDEYVAQVVDNALSLEIALGNQKSTIKAGILQKLHKIMGTKVDRNAGVIDGQRHLPFFDQSGKRNMVDGARLHHELKLLDKQTNILMKNAGIVPKKRLKLFALKP